MTHNAPQSTSAEPQQAPNATCPTWLVAAAFLIPVAVLFVHARSYYWLCDDAYISFRYVRNFIEGRGLVYNPGEYVEGYTNFFWVLHLAGLWKLLGIGPEAAATLLSAAYTAGVCGLCGWLAATGPLRPGRVWVAWSALLLLATSRTFAVWCTSGLETRQFTFFVLLSIVLWGRHLHWRRAPLYSSLALGAGVLARPEGMLIAAVCVAGFLIDAASRHRLTLLRAAAAVTPFALIAGAHAAFRWCYYGDFVPNTYWAKYVQSWPDAGLSYLVRAGIETGAYVLLPLALVGTYARLRLCGDAVHVLAIACIAAHAAYVVDVGGDHFEYRPLDFYWPLLAVAAMEGLAYLVDRLAVPCGGARDGLQLRRAFLLGGGLAVVLVYATVLQFGRHTLEYEWREGQPNRLIEEGVTVANYPAAGVVPLIPWLLPAYNGAARHTLPHAIGESQQTFRTLWRRWRAEYAPYAAAGRSVLPPQACDAVGPAGILPYFLPHLRIIDTLGLCDREIARLPLDLRNADRLIAHERFGRVDRDYLRRRGVTVDVGPAATRLADTADAEYVLRLGEKLYMRLNEIDPALLGSFGGDPRLLRWTITQAVGDFDAPDGSQGWEFHGTALAPDSRVRASPGGAGGALLTTWHEKLGDAATGFALSPVFIAEIDAVLGFQIAGGAGKETGVSLLADDDVARTWHGRNSPQPERVSYPLAAHVGARLRLRVFDESVSGWGHIDVGDVVIRAARPVSGP